MARLGTLETQLRIREGHTCREDIFAGTCTRHDESGSGEQNSSIGQLNSSQIN